MKAKDIKIESYLKTEPVKRKNSYGLYYSPFRAETKPSFKVDYTLNVWYDYGLDKGGSIVDLVMELKQCSYYDACIELENNHFSFHWDNNPKPQQHVSTIQITKVITPYNIGSLIDYCRDRGINSNVVCSNLKQVYYNNNGKEYFSLGMQNSFDGWEIIGLNRFKMVIGQKSYTLIKGISSDEVCVFEGIFDYLSYLMLSNGIIKPKHDCMILHSVNVAKKAIPRLNDYSKVHCLLDNDKAGLDCFNKLSNSIGIDKVISYDFYNDYDDLNDYLLSVHNRSYS